MSAGFITKAQRAQVQQNRTNHHACLAGVAHARERTAPALAPGGLILWSVASCFAFPGGFRGALPAFQGLPLFGNHVKQMHLRWRSVPTNRRPRNRGLLNAGGSRCGVDRARYTLVGFAGCKTCRLAHQGNTKPPFTTRHTKHKTCGSVNHSSWNPRWGIPRMCQIVQVPRYQGKNSEKCPHPQKHDRRALCFGQEHLLSV